MNPFFHVVAILATISLAAGSAGAQTANDGLYEVADTGIPSGRVFVTVAVSNGRGYRVYCDKPDGAVDQAAEQRVIRGLGYVGSSPVRLDVTDPRIQASGPSENPRLCPTSEDYPVRLIRHRTENSDTYYLRFPRDFGDMGHFPRIYIAGCRELVTALGLSTDDVIDGNPSAWFSPEDISQISCVSGTPLAAERADFADWCGAPDLADAEARTVAAILSKTSVGADALGDAAACKAAAAQLARTNGLSLDGAGLSDISPLASLPQLTSLSLAGNAIADISPLAAMPGLVYLDISRNGLAGLSGIGTLSALTTLVARDNLLTDVQTLGGMPALASLDLAGNRIADLRPLRLLTQLKDLNLARNGLRAADLPPLLKLPVIERIDLTGNAIEDVDALSDLPSKVVVVIAQNPVSETLSKGFLPYCLAVRGNGVSPQEKTLSAILSTLSGSDLTCGEAADLLAGTTVLDLSNTGIADLSVFYTLPQLIRLNLSGNAVTDVRPLSGLVHLDDLDLTGNAVVDPAPLATLPRAAKVGLDGNPLRHDSFEAACVLRLARSDALSAAVAAENDALLGAASADYSCADAARALGQLTEATFVAQGLTELRYIDRLRSLRALRLAGNAVTDLSRLAGMSALEVLDLEQTEVADLSPLAGLENLRVLNIFGTRVRDLAPLVVLPELRSLAVARADLDPDGAGEYCLIRRHEVFEAADDPERTILLALSQRHAATDANPDDCAAYAAWADRVETLNLSGQGLSDIEPLWDFRSLRELILADNDIHETSALRLLPGLRKVALGGNPLSAWPDLISAKLAYLSLDHTSVALPLRLDYPRLRLLDLAGNGISRLPAEIVLPDIEGIDLRDNALTDVTALTSAIEAEEVRLKGNPVCQALGGGINADAWTAKLRIACEHTAEPTPIRPEPITPDRSLPDCFFETGGLLDRDCHEMLYDVGIMPRPFDPDDIPRDFRPKFSDSAGFETPIHDR